MAEEQVGAEQRLRAFMEAIIHEVRANPEFAQRINQALAGALSDMDVDRKRRGPRRRNPPSLDPFTLYLQGEEHLRDALSEKNIEQLKDVVAGYGMDRARLALRWRNSERLIDLIVDTVRSRTQKGDVFRR